MEEWKRALRKSAPEFQELLAKLVAEWESDFRRNGTMRQDIKEGFALRWTRNLGQVAK